MKDDNHVNREPNDLGLPPKEDEDFLDSESDPKAPDRSDKPESDEMIGFWQRRRKFPEDTPDSSDEPGGEQLSGLLTYANLMLTIIAACLVYFAVNAIRFQEKFFH